MTADDAKVGRAVSSVLRPEFDELLPRVMSQENVELVREALDAFNRRDLYAFLQRIAPDVEFIPLQAEMEGGGAYRGHSGVRRWWENLLNVFPDFRAEVEQVWDRGEMPAAPWPGQGERCSDRPNGLAGHEVARREGHLVAHFS